MEKPKPRTAVPSVSVMTFMLESPIFANMSLDTFPGELRDIATTVAEQTGTETDLEELAKTVLVRFHEIAVGGDDSRAQAEYEERLIGVGRTVAVQGINGRFEGVTEDGNARIRCDDGLHTFFSGPMRFLD